MTDFKIIEIPEEEPEVLLSPEQVYIGDPTVYDAVNRLMRADPTKAWGDAVREVAKTVAPAPHNIAAHDARYLLAPEAAEADDARWRYEMNPGNGAGIEHFDRTAFDEAREDGPDSSQGLRYSEGLVNRAGETIQDGEDDPEAQELREIRDEAIAANERGDFYDVYARRSAPLPPTTDEVDGDDVVIMSRQLIWRAQDGPVPTTEQGREEWMNVVRELTAALKDRELVPTGPMSIEVTESVLLNPETGIPYYTAYFSLVAVPALGRPFKLMMEFDTPEGIEPDLERMRQNQAGCRVLKSRSYPQYTTAVTWDLHLHPERNPATARDALVQFMASMGIDLTFVEVDI